MMTHDTLISHRAQRNLLILIYYVSRSTFTFTKYFTKPFEQPLEAKVEARRLSSLDPRTQDSRTRARAILAQTQTQTVHRLLSTVVSQSQSEERSQKPQVVVVVTSRKYIQYIGSKQLGVGVGVDYILVYMCMYFQACIFSCLVVSASQSYSRQSAQPPNSRLLLFDTGTPLYQKYLNTYSYSYCLLSFVLSKKVANTMPEKI